MAINFPTPATVGETFVDPVTGLVYTWNGYGWALPAAASGAPVDAYTKAESDALFVNVPGDTMTGNLTLSLAWPAIILNRPDATSATQIQGHTAGLVSWNMQLGSASAAGDFVLERFNDAGAYNGPALIIERANGHATVAGTVFSTGGSFLGTSATQTVLGANGTGILLRPNFNTGVGDVIIDAAGNMTIPSAAISGTLTVYGVTTTSGLVNNGQHTNNGSIYGTGDVSAVSLTLRGDGNPGINYQLNSVQRWLQRVGTNGDHELHRYDAAGGYLGLSYRIAIDTGDTYINFNARIAGSAIITGECNVAMGISGGSIGSVADVRAGSHIHAVRGYLTQGGDYGAPPGHTFNIAWNTVGIAELWINATFIGNFAYTSDYRIKKDVAPLASTWDAVKALNPISYTIADYTPTQSAEDVAAGKPAPDPLLVANDVEQWGFIAHELQETLIPSAATGVKDQENLIQSPNPFTLLAAVTKALQEAMTRIEAQDARIAALEGAV